MKKWLTPIALLVLSAVLLVSVYVIVLAICGSNDGYAGAVYALWGIIICGVVIQPAICFAYSRRLLIDQKFRIFFTVYNSFFVSLPFLYCSASMRKMTGTIHLSSLYGANCGVCLDL